MPARPVITKFTELTDAETVDLPTLNGPLATALASGVGGGGAAAFGDLTDAATADLPTVNGPLGTALGLKANASAVSNVDNTSDANKPVSTAQQAALDLKANSADLGTAAARQSDQDLRTTDDVVFDSVNATGQSRLDEIVGDPVAQGSRAFFPNGLNVAPFKNLYFGTGGNSTYSLTLLSTSFVIKSFAKPLVITGSVGTMMTIDPTSNGLVTVENDLKVNGVTGNKVYTVATVPAASSYAGGLIAVSDETGGYTLAFSDGTSWRRVQDRAIIS
jgi:hypothetical protein